MASERSLPLGVGIDDRMVATTLSAQAREGDEHVEFSVLLPHDAVAPGEHQVVLHLLAFDGDRALPPLPIPRRFESTPPLEDVEPSAAGEARAIHFQGIDAPVEIFGWISPDAVAVAVVRRGTQLAKATWVDGEAALGFRYHFDGAPDDARLFHAVVPSGGGSTDDLHVVAWSADRRVVELPVAIANESVFRVTGPFGLRFDSREPDPAYQNY